MSPPGDVTLASYEQAAAAYRDRVLALGGGAHEAFVSAFAALVGTGDVLELGSGPGIDAAVLRDHGLRVTCSDGARSFVEMQRGQGFESRLLDIRTDDFAGPWDAVFAKAVLLHLERGEMAGVLTRLAGCVVAGGVLGLTLKEGDGEGWSDHDLGLPRHYTYWRAAVLREVMASSGWKVVLLDHVSGVREPWLFVTATRAGAV